MAVSAVCPHCRHELQLRMDAQPEVSHLCASCRKTFRVVSGSELAITLRREQALAGVVFDAEVLAADLVQDCNALLKLGVVLDKAELGAKTAGIAGGAAAAFTGHWMVGAAVAVAGLLSGVLTDNWKRIKLGEVRQKWFQRLASMNEDQLLELTSELQYRHPALFSDARGLLALSCNMDA